jgi:hypothetical protein
VVQARRARGLVGAVLALVMRRVVCMQKRHQDAAGRCGWRVTSLADWPDTGVVCVRVHCVVLREPLARSHPDGTTARTECACVQYSTFTVVARHAKRSRKDVAMSREREHDHPNVM